MKIINFFGGPGTGKSTTAARLFSDMKVTGVNCELVTEYAKEMVWEDRHNIFQDQLYLLAKQNRKLLRLQNKVDYVLTDSPILLNTIYMVENGYEQTLNQLILEVFNSYDNINILLNRTHEYQEVGRYQTEQQSDELSSDIKKLLQLHNVPFVEYDCNKINFQLIEELIKLS